MATKVLYHAKCPDGFTAAWAVWRRWKDTAEYIPVSYGVPPPVTGENDNVVLVDFSYPRAVLDSMPCRMLTVLDHHKTAQDDLTNLPEALGSKAFVLFDMDRSGAGIAWDFFHGPETRPLLVDYAEDHDLWRYALRNSREIRALFMTTPYTFEAWDDFQADLVHNWNGCVDKGKTVMLFMEQQVKMIADNASLRRLVDGGPLVPVVNATTLFSEVGEELNKRFPDTYYAAYYFDRIDGKRQWGLRTKRPGVDVSVVAKEFGGGGHKAAAGFVTSPDFIGV